MNQTKFPKGWNEDMEESYQELLKWGRKHGYAKKFKAQGLI